MKRFSLLTLLVLLIVALIAPVAAEAHFGFHPVFHGQRFERHEVVVFQPSFVPVAVSPNIVVAPSYQPSISYDPPQLLPVGPSFDPSYQQYAAGCAAASIEAVPFEVFSTHRAFFRGDARDFNVRVGPLGFVHGRVH